MSSNTPPPREAGHNLPEFSVSELSTALKRSVEDAFGHVRVRGEVSGFKRHSSGHMYFCLKDTDAVLDAVCWRSLAARLAVAPEDGLEVVCSGRLTTYAARSKYQMVVERIELAGQGALLKLLEDRRKRLAAEGLFDTARKRPIPFLPRVVGVVTSPTGAVIRDILHRLNDRFPRHVLLWPVAVQGEGAAEQVAAAIAGFNALPPGGAVPRPDVLIVARGGGSLEDLWAFNEEIVVRAAAASDIPLISAVGHETDTTLIDHAADLRAPTPTGAAEKAVPVRMDLLSRVAGLESRLVGAAGRGLEGRRERLRGLSRGLPNLRRVVEDTTQRLDDWGERLENGARALLHRRLDKVTHLGARLQDPRQQIDARRAALGQWAARLGRAATVLLDGRRQRLWAVPAHRLGEYAARLLAERRARVGQCQRLLDSYSYKNVLKRGFALVRDAEGNPVTGAAGARPGDAWAVEFKDEQVVPVVVAGATPRPRRRKDAKEGKDKQGTLL